MAKDKLKKPKNRKKRLLIVFLSVFFFIACVLAFLQAGVFYTEKRWAHFSPDYPKEDLMPLLEKSERTEEEYETLYRQTGLTKLGIDDLLEEGKEELILEIQDFLFKEHEIFANHFNPFTYQEELKDELAPFGAVREGDIIVTGTTRVSWLRYGHAALVVDGKKRLIVESVGPGAKSELNPVECLSIMANFLVLRPKVSTELKQEIATYAKENLVGLSYRFTIGLFSKKYPKGEIEKTQCAHLVWYAYKKFGIDLDFNGGWLVKPQDMAKSPQVELVQAFGFDLDELWS